MDHFFHTLQQMNPMWAYIALFLSSYVENIFPPIPGDTATLMGAFLTGRGLLNFWGVFISTTLGSVMGFMTLYTLAYWLERGWIERRQPRWISATKIDKVELWFRKYGYWIVLLNRFLSGVRSVISLVAGFSRLNSRKVFWLSLISCAVWNGMLIYGGSVLGRNWKDILHFLQIYNRIILGIIILLAAGYGIYRCLHYRQNH